MAVLSGSCFNVMKKFLNIFICFISFLFLILPSKHVSAFQLFLDPLCEGIVNNDLPISILVLNECGELEKSFSGKKNVDFKLKRESGVDPDSISFSRNVVSFKNGMGQFSVFDRESESILLSVLINELQVSEEINLVFENKDIFPPEVKEVETEGPYFLYLTFNEEVADNEALDAGNYLAITNKKEVHPDSIEYHNDYVILEFEKQIVEGEEGYIELKNIKDLSGNEIPSGLRSPDFEGDCGCVD